MSYTVAGNFTGSSRVGTLFIAGYTVVVTQGGVGEACAAEERWAVKTLSDSAARSVDVSRPQVTTIGALNALLPSCGVLPDVRTLPPEFLVYEVTGQIEYVGSATDHDYHLDLVDPSSGKRIVARIPDPACPGAINSPYVQALVTARNAFESLGSLSSIVGTFVKVRGVGFYNDLQNQIGMADNCLELHPLVSIQSVSAPTISTTPSVLRFNSAKSSVVGTLTVVTPPQDVTVTFNGPPSAWTATADQPWLQITNGSASGPGRFTVTIVNPESVLGGSTGIVTVSATITVTATGTAQTPAILPVQLVATILPSGQPRGLVDTPTEGTSGITGSIAVTGWALDDIGVSDVKIYRNCLPGIDNPVTCQSMDGNSVVFIGDATFVAGARPDVENTYGYLPMAYRAGWGYLLLTNMLPHVAAPSNPTSGGQGPLTLFAYATDVEGHHVLLGQRSITLDNDHGAKPFGAIDTPTQGGTASGLMQNYGWALTPGSAMIPTNGSTITVVVDGVARGAVSYNLCRDGAPIPPGPGGCRDDVATLFPTMTNVKNGSGAIGVLNLDTTTLADGVHVIAWGVTDDQGRGDGIGSRYFNVLNSTPSLTASGTAPRTATATTSVSASSLQHVLATPPASLGAAAELAWRSISDNDIDGRAGFDFEASLEAIHADATGVRHVRLRELGRVELHVGRDTTAGYLRVNGTLRALPAGSQLDTAAGVFTWAPGPGFIGTYDLVFLKEMTQVVVAATIVPKPSETVGLMRGWVDLPGPRTTVAGPFTVAGWAIDTDAWQGSGVGAVHVWAQRRDVPSAPEIFLGAATVGGARPDVAVIYGAQFDRAGWSVSASGLAPGTYDVTAYFWSTRTDRFEDARMTTITVR